MLWPLLFISLASSYWTASLHVSNNQWQQPPPLLCVSFLLSVGFINPLDEPSCHWATVSVWFLLIHSEHDRRTETKLKPRSLDIVCCAVCLNPSQPLTDSKNTEHIPFTLCSSRLQPVLHKRTQWLVGIVFRLSALRHSGCMEASCFRGWEHIVHWAALLWHVIHSA